jgi:adenylate kinase family enzyme
VISFHPPLRRLIVVGRAGSGKSTLARRLSAELGVAPIHTDFLGWRPGWRRTHLPEYRAQIGRAVEAECWVIDGTSPRTFDLRIPRSQAVIWLSPPVWRCLFRVMFRTLFYLRRNRPTMALGCKERFNFALFSRLVAFDGNVGPKIEEAMLKYDAYSKLIVIRNVADAQRLSVEAISRLLIERDSQSRTLTT